MSHPKLLKNKNKHFLLEAEAKFLQKFRISFQQKMFDSIFQQFWMAHGMENFSIAIHQMMINRVYLSFDPHTTSDPQRHKARAFCSIGNSNPPRLANLHPQAD